MADVVQSQVKKLEDETIYLDVKKGDKVRLIVDHHDGYQVHKAGSVVRWWSDSPPTAANAQKASDKKPTPLDAPVFPNSAPPADYVNPVIEKA